MNTYNKLESACDADAAVHANPDFDGFLSSFARLTAEYELQTIVGACLLHRHFSLRDGQAIVERSETWRGQTALISMPETRGGGVAPSMWRFGVDGSAPEPLEFSEDPAVFRGAELVPAAFCSSFNDLLVRSELHDLIGMTILQRETLPLEPGERYLEETDAGQSVVVVCPPGPEEGDAITTVWAPGEVMGCSVYNTCHQRNICRFADNEHRHILGHTTERSHHRS